MNIPNRASDAGPDDRTPLEEDDRDAAYDGWCDDQLGEDE
jgi:hypothetical protein